MVCHAAYVIAQQAIQQLLSTAPGEAVSPRHVEEIVIKRILTARCTLSSSLLRQQLQAYLLCCIVEVRQLHADGLRIHTHHHLRTYIPQPHTPQPTRECAIEALLLLEYCAFFPNIHAACNASSWCLADAVDALQGAAGAALKGEGAARVEHVLLGVLAVLTVVEHDTAGYVFLVYV